VKNFPSSGEQASESIRGRELPIIAVLEQMKSYI
jgi:hypothetical protein